MIASNTMPMDMSMGLVTLDRDNHLVPVCMSGLNANLADIVCRMFNFSRAQGFAADMSGGAPVDMTVKKYITFANCMGEIL